jgi:LCP family protein required for cell wall assembly
LTITTLLTVGAVVAVNYTINTKLAAVSRVGLHTAAASGGPQNFLVIGSDTRAFVSDPQQAQQFGNQGGNGGQRSDTLMVVRIDPGTHQTLVVSFPRDLWVKIPGQGFAKINAAYNVGPQKVIDMLKADFGIDIHHYIAVDFQSFQGVVNAIGTVPVYVPYPARDQFTGLYVPFPGCVRLTGEAALAYSRSRELEYYSVARMSWMFADLVPDIGRIARQQDFLRQLANVAVAKSLSDPITANNVTNQVFKHLTVDQGLSKDDILSLVDAFRTINPNDTSHVQFATLPWAEGPNQQGQSVLYVAEPDADAVLARLGGSPPNSTTVAIQHVTSTTPSTKNTAASTAITPSTTPSTTSPSSAPIQNQNRLGTPAARTSPC